MLILTRCKEQKIVVGCPSGIMTIMVVHITPTRVRLGLTAPSDWVIEREELTRVRH